MSESRTNPVDDATLKAYLCGGLAQDEREQLDELSVADDEFAARLDAVETDLVDAYVRGELTGHSRDQFERVYLSTPRRRQRVAFARSFTAAADAHTLPPAASSRQMRPAARKDWLAALLAFFTPPRLAFAGGFAVLLVVSLLVAGHFHTGSPVEQAQQAPPPTATAPLAKPTPATPASADSSTGKRIVSSIPASVFAFALAPQTRGGAPIPTLALPAGTTRADLSLGLESNDYPRYRATLKSLSEGSTLWSAGGLKAVTKGPNSTLSARLPAKLLRPGLFQVELAGMPAQGEQEPVNSYVFRVVAR